MAARYCRFNGAFERTLRAKAAEAFTVLGFDILPFLMVEDETYGSEHGSVNDTHISQVCIFIHQCAMFEWLEELGILPDAVLPHSVGEVAAAGA